MECTNQWRHVGRAGIPTLPTENPLPSETTPPAWPAPSVRQTQRGGRRYEAPDLHGRAPTLGFPQCNDGTLPGGITGCLGFMNPFQVPATSRDVGGSAQRKALSYVKIQVFNNLLSSILCMSVVHRDTDMNTAGAMCSLLTGHSGWSALFLNLFN